MISLSLQKSRKKFKKAAQFLISDNAEGYILKNVLLEFWKYELFESENQISEPILQKNKLYLVPPYSATDSNNYFSFLQNYFCLK